MWLVALALVATGLQVTVPTPAVAADTVDDSTSLRIEAEDLRAALIVAIEAPMTFDETTGCEALVLDAVVQERYSAGRVDQAPAQVAAELQAVVDSYVAERGRHACSRGSVDEGVLDLLEFAETRPGLAAARDALFEETGVSLKDPIAALFAHPALPAAISALEDSVDQVSGALQTTFGAVMNVVADAEAGLDAARNSVLAGLASLDNGQTTADALKALADGKLSTAAVAVGSHLFSAGLLATGVLVTGATNVAKAAVKGVGKLVKAAIGVVKVTTKIIKAVSAAAKAVLRQLARPGELLRIVSQMSKSLWLLANGVPPGFEHNDQRILEAIDAVRQDVAALRAEMNERFDAIDKKLDEIFAEMVESFTELRDKLANIESGIEAIRSDLIRLATQVDRLDRNLYGLFRDSQNRELWTQVNTAIGWRDRSVGGAQMSNGEFLAFEGFFYSWATNSAYDEIATGPADRAFGDDDLERELAAVPMEGNLSYLSALGTARYGLPPLSAGKLPNLRDFAVAARAYSALVTDNPNYLTPGIRQRIQELITRGEAAAAAVARLRAVDAPGVDTGNRAFNGALASYRAAGTGDNSVGTALASAESAFVSSLRTPRNNPLALDPWGPHDQPSPLDLDVPYTEQACPGLQTPTTMGRTQAFSMLLRNAMRLGAVQGRVVCGVTATNLTSAGTGGGSFKRYYADFTVEFRTEFDDLESPKEQWSPVLTKRKTFEDVEWCEGFADECVEPDAHQVASDNWPLGFGAQGNWKRQFEESASTIVPFFSFLPFLTGRRFRAVQQSVYGHLIDQLGQPAVAGPLKRLTGTKRLLEAYAEFALPRSVQDDGEVRGLLHGAAPLPAQGGEDDAVAAALRAAAEVPPAQNVRLAIVADITAKADEFEQAVASALSAAGPVAARRAAGDPPALETIPLLATTLDRLQLTADLADIEDEVVVPPPPPPPAPAPRLTGAKAKAPKLGKLAKSAVAVTASSNAAGTLDGTLSITRKVAKAADLGKLTLLAKARAGVRPGAVKLLLRVPKSTAKKLAKLTKPLKARLLLALRDGTGRTAPPLRLTVTLKR